MEAVLQGYVLAEAPAGSATHAGQAELMRRCQAGEAGAFEEFVKFYHGRVHSVIYSILRNSNDAEDIAQQVFTKIYFSLKKFNFRSAVSTWVYKITVNECYDHLRKQKVRKAVNQADLSEEEVARLENTDWQGTGGPARLEAQMLARDTVAKLMSRLPEEDRILLVLKEVEGYPVHEIAEIIGINENTVKVRLFRARQKLLQTARRKRF